MRLAWLASCFLWILSLSARPKNDVIHFKNGDRMTCEIKRLDQGKLVVSPPYTESSIDLDWHQIERVESEQLFAFEDRNGNLSTGMFTPGLANIDRISQLDRTTRDRFSGTADSGFIYTKANEQSQLSVNGRLNYVTTRWTSSGEAHLTFNSLGDGTSFNRANYQVQATRMYHKQWYAQGFADFLSSDEQALNLRTTVGGGIGRWLLRRESARLAFLAGSVFTREDYSAEDGSAPQVNSVEAVLAADFAIFEFKGTEVLITSRLFPGLSQLGRVRLDTKGSIHYELYKDLYFDLSIYSNFDSRPQGDRRKSDYGTTLGIGFKF